MSDTPPKPEHKPGSKASRLAAARSRVEFWTIFSEEFDDPSAVAYFRSRLRSWQSAVNHIQMEPEP